VGSEVGRCAPVPGAAVYVHVALRVLAGVGGIERIGPDGVKLLDGCAG
jgi:hypothetical protein